MYQNPLLERLELPRLEAVNPEDIEPAVTRILRENRDDLDQLLASPVAITWDELAQPMEEMEQRLHDCWSVVSHLHAVQNSVALRRAYDEALPLITQYSTELGQNHELYQAYLALQRSPLFSGLSEARRKAVDTSLRDFRLSGVALGDGEKRRFADLQRKLAKLATTFSNNVLDAGQGWLKHLGDTSQLDGVPESVLQTLRQQASAKQLEGFVVTLDIPSYMPVMQYASDRDLRRELYLAYNTRASELGPNAGRWDNGGVMEEILAARHEMAGLLDFADYAELSLATKMAATPQQVVEFLQDLVARSRPQALLEFSELQQFARDRDGLASLQAWDVPYYSELLRRSLYAISEQELRPFFPAPRVIAGMFELVGRLFTISIEQDESIPSNHPDVMFYRVHRGGVEIAGFYLDLYARDNKRGGAWMADCRNRYRDSRGNTRLPVAFLTCNFTPSAVGEPSLLTHGEVTTLFHEFGHGLHHMLTGVDVAAVSGINGVPWDAVELPSQFLENWCWQKPVLELISGHYQTGETLPGELLERLLAAKNFQSGMLMMRQLELSLFDFHLHHGYDPLKPAPIQRVLDDVRDELSVVPVADFNRFQHGFSHIFAGGYAAGYYSYKWAEVLSADAFSRFEEEGLFNRDIGKGFLHWILEPGGSRDPAELFREFRGRDPDSEALLRHNGIHSGTMVERPGADSSRAGENQ